MDNIALAGTEAQSECVEVSSGPQPSANGGVLLLARAWAALGGSERLCQAIRWQGRAGPLLLFALVALPVLSAKSVCAIAKACLKPKEPLMQLLSWRDWLNQRRLARFVASPRHDWLGVLGAMVGALAHHAATDNGAEGIIATFGEAEASGLLLVLDGGVLGNVPPSTLVDCTTPVPRIIRDGAIPRAELRRMVGSLAP